MKQIFPAPMALAFEWNVLASMRTASSADSDSVSCERTISALASLTAFAGFPRHDFGITSARYQELSGAAQERGALVSRHGGGLGLGFDRSIQRVVEIGLRRARRAVDHVLR